MTDAPKSFGLKLLIRKMTDGRYLVSSPNLPGLHMAADDLDKIKADLEPIIKDLLYFNVDFVADEIKWIPSLDQTMRDIKAAFSQPVPPEEFFVVSGHAAKAA